METTDDQERLCIIGLWPKLLMLIFMLTKPPLSNDTFNTNKFRWTKTILQRTKPEQLLKEHWERSQHRTLKNTCIIPTFTVSHELKVLLAEVNDKASSVLLAHIGDARHMEHVLRKLVLHEKNVRISWHASS